MADLAERVVASMKEELDDDDLVPTLRESAGTQQIDELETKLGVKLPPSYRAFLEAYDGMSNFQGTHKLFGTQDHKSEWANAQMAFYQDADQTEPFENGAIPFCVAEADDGINNFWAFDPNDRRDDGELAVVDWDHGTEENRYGSFKEWLEAELHGDV